MPRQVRKIRAVCDGKRTCEATAPIGSYQPKRREDDERKIAEKENEEGMTNGMDQGVQGI